KPTWPAAGARALRANESRGRIVMFQGTDAFAPVLSVIVTVKAYSPAVVPAPASFPVAGSRVMPGGIVPSAPKVYGPRPPTALTPVATGFATSRLTVKPVGGALVSISVRIASGATTSSEN